MNQLIENLEKYTDEEILAALSARGSSLLLEKAELLQCLRDLSQEYKTAISRLEMPISLLARRFEDFKPENSPALERIKQNGWNF